MKVPGGHVLLAVAKCHPGYLLWSAILGCPGRNVLGQTTEQKENKNANNPEQAVAVCRSVQRAVAAVVVKVVSQKRAKMQEERMEADAETGAACRRGWTDHMGALPAQQSSCCCRA